MDSGNNEKKNTGPHNFSLKNRRLLEMDGVKEVVSFNEMKVVLQTNQGVVDLKGKDLNIQKLNLDDGSIRIEGFILAIEYSDRVTKKGIMNRLFK